MSPVRSPRRLALALLAAVACGPKDAPPSLPDVYDASEPLEERLESAERLASVAEAAEEESADPALVARAERAFDTALDDPSAQVRERSAASLARIGPKLSDASVPRLYAALDDADPWVRAHAVAAIYRRAKKHPLTAEQVTRWRAAVPDAVATVDRGLDAADPGVRARAVRVAWDLEGTARSVSPKLFRLLDDPDPAVRRHVPWALAEMGAGRLVPLDDLLRKLETNPDVTVRQGLLQLVWAYGAEAVPPLVALLDHESADVRKDAAQALGSLGAPARSALPKLREVAEDDGSFLVRRTAQGAVDRLEGRTPER